MAKYTVKFVKGDYTARQEAANALKAVAYVEHHFNSGPSTAGYVSVVVGSNASQTSKNWGRWYAQAIGNAFGVKLYQPDGVVVGGFGGRGDGNLKYTRMPALLLEPLFCSNPLHAGWIRSAQGQQRLAEVLADSIRRFFPDGGTIAFSVGHKYKTSSPKDRGAEVFGGGMEADYAELVLKAAQTLLEGEPAAALDQVKIRRGDALLQAIDVDPDTELRWDPVTKTLYL